MKNHPEGADNEPLFERPRGSIGHLGNKGGTPAHSRHSLRNSAKKGRKSAVTPDQYSASTNNTLESDITEDFVAKTQHKKYSLQVASGSAASLN